LPRVKTYDARLVQIALGPHIVSGKVDGTFLNIEAHGDGVGKEVGADGETVRSIDPDETATLTITVQYGSETMAFLQHQYNLDRVSHGEGMFPVLVKDMKSNDIFSAEDAWVDNMISLEYGKEASNREVTIETGPAKWDPFI